MNTNFAPSPIFVMAIPSQKCHFDILFIKIFRINILTHFTDTAAGDNKMTPFVLQKVWKNFPRQIHNCKYVDFEKFLVHVDIDILEIGSLGSPSVVYQNVQLQYREGSNKTNCIQQFDFSFNFQQELCRQRKLQYTSIKSKTSY